MRKDDPSVTSDEQGSAAVNSTERKERVDWKAIAIELARGCKFAMNNLQAKGGGMLLNMDDRSMLHWREFMADRLEKMPGVTVDREKMYVLDMPRSRQRKALAEIDKKRAAETTSEPNHGE